MHGGDRPVGPGAASGAHRTRTGEPPPILTRRRLEIALGLLWLFDGALQFQPYNFTPGFFAGILGMADMGLPEAVSGADYHVALLLADHPAGWNAVFASIQVALGVGLLWPRTARWARAGSIPWALGVWVVGEGFGGVFMGGTSLLTGAPGAALLYALIAVLVRPSSRSGPGATRFAPASWVVVWIGSALLELGATNHGSTVPAAQIRDTATGQWRALRLANDAVASLVAGDGRLFAVVLGIVGAAIGLGGLYRPTRRAALLAGIGVGVFTGVVGQDLGLVFSGQATDPGSGPLLVLFSLAVMVVTATPRRPAVDPARLRPAEGASARAVPVSAPLTVSG